MIPLIQGLRKPNQPIKTVYDSNLQLINEMGGDVGIAGVDGMREYTSWRQA
jgi:hypothetical protein